MKILSLNVNGLRLRPDKVLTCVQENNIDTLCLQEVHTLSDQEKHDFEKKVRGIGFFDTNGGFTGTGIVVRQNIQNMGIEHVKTDNPYLRNRLTHLKITSKEIFHVISVYAPPNVTQKRRFFYSNLKDYLHTLSNFNIIMAGDFNYVENNDDRMPQLNKNDKFVKRIFNTSTFKLVDTFRKLQNTKIEYTHKTARIDRIYITTELSTQITNCKHLSNIADHKAVCLNMNIEEFKPWGRFYWKLNSSNLEENGYLKLIEDLFQDFELRRENVDILENWEIFKNEVKNVSKSYSNAKAKQRKTQILINKEIKTYYTDGETLDRIEKIDNEINIFRSKGNLIRSRNDDLNKIFEEGKEISRKMEIKKGHAKLIFQIQKDDIIYTEKEEILQLIHDFYQDLYLSQNIQDQKIDDYLADFKPPKLENEDKNDLKSFISEIEILRAIEEQNNNKSPGEDGLSSEFYKKFKKKIAPILTEIYNNIYIREELIPSMQNGIIRLLYKKNDPSNLKKLASHILIGLRLQNINKNFSTKIKRCNAKIIKSTTE